MSLTSDFTVSCYDFDDKIYAHLDSEDQTKNFWPLVYILSDGKIKEAYIGETADTMYDWEVI